jgi:uncharacterized caspase-like protein
MNDHDYAVVVGISKYGSLRPQLEGPEKDATEFADWLRSPQGGALPPANVTLIRSSGYANPPTLDPYLYEPTLSQVRAAFAKLIFRAKSNFANVPRVGRRLYIYLSGHGITPRVDPTTSIDLSGLLTANCAEDAIYENVSGQVYVNWFHQSHAFAEILLFMDCCRSDKSDASPQADLPTTVPDGRPNEVQVFCAWATQWDARAYELPLGSPPEKRGVFTYALLEALTAGTPDAEGHLTPNSIVGHLSIRVPQLRNGDASQAPQFYPPKPDDRIVLLDKVKARAATNLTITFAATLFGQPVELQDGSFTPLQTHTASDRPWKLALPPGTYVVRVDGRDTSVSLRPNEAKEQDVA